MLLSSPPEVPACNKWLKVYGPLHFFTVFNITRLVEVLIASTSAINLLGEVELAVVIIIPERQA